ncbi:MAG: thiolase family protein [Frankia sp.]|nr:thiolase family protein [Frankia sp.]
MSGRMRSSNQVAIVGFAHSQVQRHAPRSLGALAVETGRRAVEDAGLRTADIDGFVTAALFPTSGAHAVEDGTSIVSAQWMAAHLGGADARYTANFDGVGALTGAVALAVNAVASGAADHVLMHRALHNPRGGRYHDNPMRTAPGPLQWTAPQGFFGPLQMIALTYQEYAQRYGATRESLAQVLVEARRNGSRIPWSYWYGRPLSAEEYLAAPFICDPICRYDCDIPVDGVATFVLTSAERAADLPHRPVYVAGYAGGLPPRRRVQAHWPLDDLQEAGGLLVRRLWERSGLAGPAEVDLPQVYDGFSPFVYLWLEALGYCQPGEAHRFVAAGGIDSGRPDALPALTSGGALGNGRMHGVPQMVECYLQLSGRAGDRQRGTPTTAVACHSSPHYGGAVAYTNTPF